MGVAGRPFDGELEDVRGGQAADAEHLIEGIGRDAEDHPKLVFREVDCAPGADVEGVADQGVEALGFDDAVLDREVEGRKPGVELFCGGGEFVFGDAEEGVEEGGVGADDLAEVEGPFEQFHLVPIEGLVGNGGFERLDLEADGLLGFDGGEEEGVEVAQGGVGEDLVEGEPGDERLLEGEGVAVEVAVEFEGGKRGDDGEVGGAGVFGKAERSFEVDPVAEESFHEPFEVIAEGVGDEVDSGAGEPFRRGIESGVEGAQRGDGAGKAKRAGRRVDRGGAGDGNVVGTCVGGGDLYGDVIEGGGGGEEEGSVVEFSGATGRGAEESPKGDVEVEPIEMGAEGVAGVVGRAEHLGTLPGELQLCNLP